MLLMLVDEACAYNLVLIGLESFFTSFFFISLLSLIGQGESRGGMANILTFFLLKTLVFIGSALKGLVFSINLLNTA